MGARIIEGDAKLEHLVVMRYLIVDIAIMSQRILWMLIHSNVTIFLAMILKGSFAQCVILNRMFNKIASNAGFAWGNTFAQSATYSMMMCRRISITVINVKSAGCCYTNVMKESHTCIEGAMHHNCPVCFEYIFDTTKDISMLPCGHTIHVECLMQMRQHLQYSCPVCSKSYCDMSRVWELLDQEVASTAMPEIYQNKMVWILCNDCTVTSEVNFHVVAHKCPSCKSYNTKQTRGGTSSYSNVTEMVR